MVERPDDPSDWGPPRPIPETYWLVPGRLLVGEFPGSLSRAEAMERLRRFLLAGVTCFVDLTEPRELPSYEALLPFATPEGRRVEYLREPLPDHGVPESRDVMARILAVLDDALAAGHLVYVHCRAGVGRSATVAGCWLASRSTRPGDALEELQRCWQQSAKSQVWQTVPETDEQVAYVREWGGHRTGSPRMRTAGAVDFRERACGALLGLAAGDAAGTAYEDGAGASGHWSQHTSLALCLAESLLECGRADSRDQIERYLRWQREGHLSATGRPGPVTPDVAKALATYQWRRQATAGSHDPRDRTTASLPRVVAAVLYSLTDPAGAVQLAGECARTTHQSPFVIDACRYYAAMLVGAFEGAAPASVLEESYEPVPGLWKARPLKPVFSNIAASSRLPPAAANQKKPHAPEVVATLARVRTVVAEASDFDDAIRRACDGAVEPSLQSALAGTLMGAFYGAGSIPPERRAALARVDLLESFALRLVEHGRSSDSAAGGNPGP